MHVGRESDFMVQLVTFPVLIPSIITDCAGKDGVPGIAELFLKIAVLFVSNILVCSNG